MAEAQHSAAQPLSPWRRSLAVVSGAALMAAVVCVLVVALDKAPDAVELSTQHSALGTQLEEGAMPAGLGSMSGLKPAVSPFPDTYYNVFNPQIRHRPHHHWSKRHVRTETVRIMKLIEAAKNWDLKNLEQERARESNFSAVIREGVDGVDKRIVVLRKALEEIGKDMKEAIHKEDAPIEGEEKDVQVDDKEEDEKKRGVWEELLEHHGLENWEKLLKEARRQQLQKTEGYQMKRDRLKFDRLDKEDQQVTRMMNEQLKQLELGLETNFTRFKAQNEKFRTSLDTTQSNQKRDYGERGRVAVGLTGSMHGAESAAAEIKYNLKDATDTSRKVADKVAKLNGKSDKLELDAEKIEETIESQHDEIKEAASAVREELERLHENLNQVDDLRQRVKDQMAAQTLAHEALESKDDKEMEKMKFAIQDLQPALAKVEEMAVKVQGMQTTVNTGMDKTLDEIKKVEAQHRASEKRENDLASDIKDAMSSLENMQKQGVVENVKKSYSDIQNQLTPISTEIALVQTFKEQVAGMNTRLDDKLKEYQAIANALFTRRKQWEEVALEEDKGLKSTVDAEVDKELGHMKTITDAIASVQQDVDDDKDFKEKSTKVLEQLKIEMGDFTESLLILDKKLSGQIAECDTKINELKGLQKEVADPEEINVAGDRIDVKLEEVLNGFDDVIEESRREKEAQKQMRTTQRTLRNKLSGLKAYLEAAITKAKRHLKKHNDLFERISCTCYDGFKLTPPPGKQCIPSSIEDQSTCEVCPEGSYCNRGLEFPCKITCPAGEELRGECPEGSVSDTMVCEPCPEGTFCQDGAQIPCKTTCPDGKLMSGSCPEGSETDTIQCLPCPEGFYCKDGQQFECKTTCDDGQELVGECEVGSTEDDTSCEMCPSGSYCSNGVAYECRKSCPDGNQLIGECPEGSLEDQTTCEPCPEDNFCTEGKIFPCKTTCEAGKVLQGKCNPGSGTDTVKCKWCPAGFFCENGEAKECKSTCPAGELLSGRCRKGSDKDTTTCAPCPEGFYCQDGGKEECKTDCRDGKELEGKCNQGSKNDTTVCDQCPEDFYCARGYTFACKNRCWDGKYLVAGCPAGSSEDTTKCEDCPEGSYCNKGGQKTACRTSCPDGKTLKGSCPKQSYRDTTWCAPCPAGKYCVGDKIFDCKTTCQDGYELKGYCGAGSDHDKTTCEVCPEGSFCKDGVRKECKKTCPRGQVLTGTCEEGSTEAITECKPCPAGHYCKDGEATECKSTCPAGEYLEGECEEGSRRDDTRCRRCPAGFFCANGERHRCKEECEDGKRLIGECKRGSGEDVTKCEPCPEGTFCKDGELEDCKKTCPLGEILSGTCTEGSESDTTACEACPEDFFCTEGEAHECTKTCPDGQHLRGHCALGSKEDVECIDCRRGTYCKDGVVSDCKSTCDDGEVLVGECVAGSKEDTTQCHICPEDHYCSDGKQTPCKTSCEDGTKLSGECPAGSAQDSKQCLPCPAGQFCKDGLASDCKTTCPNGKLLTGECTEGSTQDGTSCDPCPAGSYCIAGMEYECQTFCGNGTLLKGECDVGSASDSTTCEPCPAGSYCKGGVALPCKETCEEGMQLEGFCAAGSTHDNTTCVECPAGFFCQDGVAKMCKTSCDAGELFTGECIEGSAQDTTSCEECPEGFYCRNGVQIKCRTECPEEMVLDGSCPAGSATDTTSCKTLGTPPPTMVVWLDHKSASENVGPDGDGALDRMGSETKLANAKSGSIEGSFPLPVQGGTWFVQFYIGWPKAGQDYPHNFPETAAGSPSVDDEVKIEINGATKVYKGNAGRQGKMQYITQEITADVLLYRFEFTSDNDNEALHPFVANAEVTLLHDSTTGPDGEGFGKGKASFKGKCINAIDGKAVKKLFKQHNGYEKRQIQVTGEARVLVFDGSKLIQKIPVNKAKWRVRKIPAGKYTCVGIMPGFYSFYNDECTFEDRKEFFTYVMFSPRLRPGEARTYLSWGPKPRDMDLYMLVPHKASAEPPCEVNWNNKACTSAAVHLDYDAKSGYGPETISLHKFRDGKYRIRVSEYRGIGNHKEWLLKSDSQVTINTEGFNKKYSVHKDGFIKGRNWYVFTIDGRSKRVLPCNEMTCGHGYHDKKALGNDA